MYKLLIHNLAEDGLKNLAKINPSVLRKLANALDEIAQNGTTDPQTRKLKNTKNIYRKRVGRWRILFSIENNDKIIDVWIIAVEKDTKKDYNRWIRYITYQIGS